MWERYRKMFLRPQIVIWMVAWAVYARTHHLIVAVAFLVVMQAGSLLGAMWGFRRSKKLFATRPNGLHFYKRG